jgi:hypothetical protein
LYCLASWIEGCAEPAFWPVCEEWMYQLELRQKVYGDCGELWRPS